jgi:DNA-directed RNA polymerase subunit RPC12/RpoP
MTTEEDAQKAALQEYFDSDTPAGYGASFRAGWAAGRTWASWATRISFVCANCSEEFEEPVQAFIDDRREVVLAPALCRACGHGAEDEDWAARPVCEDCGMRHEPDDRASCIEGHGTDVEWGEDSAAQQLERGPR